MVDALVGNDYSYCLCRGLAEVGLDVTLVTVAGRSAPFPCPFTVLDWAPSKASGSRLAKLGMYGAYLTRLVRLAVGQRRDAVVHIQFLRRPLADAVFYTMMTMLGVRLVFTSHNVVPHEAGRTESLAIRMIRWRASAVIAHTDHLRRELIGTGEVEPDRIAVIPHGDFDYYQDLAQSSDVTPRQALGLADDALVVLAFGLIREYKGIDLLIDAAALALPDIPSLHVVVAGRAPSPRLGAELQAQIERLDLTGHVTLHDRFIPNEEVARYFEAADLLALPYRSISHSGVLHLAYSFGKPVLVTDVGDFAEMVNGQGTGFVAATSKPEELSRVLLEAASDPDRLRDMGNRARMISRRDYSWRDIAVETAELYRRLEDDEVELIGAG